MKAAEPEVEPRRKSSRWIDWLKLDPNAVMHASQLVGLGAAIPAYIAYNKFSIDAGKFTGRLEAFADDLQAAVARRLGAPSAPPPPPVEPASGLNLKRGV